MLKSSDLKLITQLRENARQTLTEISKKTKIPISTLYDKLRAQEADMILKHTTLIDFSKMGYFCRVNILLKSNRECKERLLNYLKMHPSVNNLFKINNGYDYLAEGVFMNVNDLEEFLDDLEKKFIIDASQIHYVVEDIKREQFLIPFPAGLPNI